MSAELTDVESVRQFMQKSLADKFQDDDIEVLIKQSSQAIERYCSRQFAKEPAAVKTFELLPNETWDAVDLKPYEFRTVEEVTVDGTVIAAAQYRPYPYPSRDGTFFGLAFGELPESTTTPAFPFQTRKVEVKATWGLPAIPDELQHLANVTVESWCHLRRDPGMGAGEGFGESTPTRGYDLPPAVFYGLKRWVRPTASA